MNGDRHHVPDLILEQYRLKELPVEEVDRLERLLREDHTLGERLAALDRSDHELARQYPAGWLATRINDRLSSPVPRPKRSHRIRRLALASAAVAGAVVMVLARPWGDLGPATRGIKGLEPSLAVYRQTSTGSETLADGAPAHAGDVLLLGYVSAGRTYGAIVSIDGRGIVTRHLPARGARPATLRAGGTILLDEAYELDDAPAWERFYLVTAEHEFDVDAVIEAARRAASRDLRSPPPALPLPGDLNQSTFLIQKEVRP
jgi:hypothetical protein